MSDPAAPSAAHAQSIIGGVVRAAVLDAGAEGVVLLASDTPEGNLAGQWMASSLGRDRVVPAPPSVHDEAGTINAEEYVRAAARILARQRRLLLAHPACKTVLLLSDAPPPERLLPFGDVYASTLAEWAGGVTLGEDVRKLADPAGGIEPLDSMLRDWLEGRSPLRRALESLPDAARPAVFERLRLNRALRRWPRCVPKLGTRTLWIDAFV
jgi:hypothetical protein